MHMLRCRLSQALATLAGLFLLNEWTQFVDAYEQGNLLQDQYVGFDSAPGRQLLATRAHRDRLHHVHGWLMCLGWGCLIPIGVVIAAFRTVRGFRSSWFYLHATLQVTGFLVALAGITVGTYLEIDEKLQWQHRVIGITVTVLGGLQVVLALLARPRKTRQLRRTWNLVHWTLGRAALALAIANIFIGFTLSQVAYSHIIAQAVVLGGLFIIVMLKNDIDYLLIRITPEEEEHLLQGAYTSSGKGQKTLNPVSNPNQPNPNLDSSADLIPSANGHDLQTIA